MGFRKWCVVLACCLIVPGMVQAQEIELELQMPGSMFGPGSTFSLDLRVTNTGPALSDAQLYVALTIGTGDFWFFPGWKQYPPDIDWVTVDVYSPMVATWGILPEILWPWGAGTYDGAMFFAAISHNGVLMSNLADITFGWMANPEPTQTPTQMPPPTPPPGFSYIAPGSFTMGSPSTEFCRDANEVQHQVTLTRGFFMMQTEVTRQMWVDLKAAQPTLPNDPANVAYSPSMNHPVQSSTWYEAVLFANLMSLRDGYTRCFYKDAGFTTPVNATNYTTGDFYCNFNANGYRLPTEAEWEYACRAGTTGAFSCSEPNYNAGNCSSCTSGTHPTLEQYCVYCANDPGLTAVVGSKLPNPAGLYDMHGNIAEWGWDWYGSYPSGSVTDPTGSTTGMGRVVRGGCWDYTARYSRSVHRSYGTMSYRLNILGFRLVRTIN